jgi:hypothetical protein
MKMNKAQLDLCREVVKLFNKASFQVTGLEMLQNANVLSMFSKMIIDGEKMIEEYKPINKELRNGMQRKKKEANEEIIEVKEA